MIIAVLLCRHMPSHASREVLIVLGSLSTCDPGDIADTIKVSVISVKHSFSTAAPSVWNSLPTSVLNCDSLTLFKAKLKTHLFSSVSG